MILASFCVGAAIGIAVGALATGTACNVICRRRLQQAIREEKKRAVREHADAILNRWRIF